MKRSLLSPVWSTQGSSETGDARAAINTHEVLKIECMVERRVTPKNPAGTTRHGRRGILTTVEIGHSDVVARESRPTNPARGCLLPSRAPMFHHRERTRSGAPSLSALDDWATINRVHAMCFTRLANNTCGKGELINWRLGGFPSIWVVKIGPQRSSGSVWISQGDLQLHVIDIVRLRKRNRFSCRK